MRKILILSQLAAIAVLIGLLSGCANTITIPDTYDQLGNPATLLNKSSLPKHGVYYTRLVGDSGDGNPNDYYYASATGVNHTVLDVALELKQGPGGDYYRLHIYPKYSVSVAELNPWVRVYVYRQGKDQTPVINLFAMLPTNRTLDSSGALTTDWFVCDACTAGHADFFTKLAQGQSQTTCHNLNDCRLVPIGYRFVAKPDQVPNWQGDMLARQLIFRAKQQQQEKEQQKVRAALEAMDAKLPPEIRRDKYMLELSRSLKQQDYQAALKIFPKLEALPIPLDRSLEYFYGEALLKSGEPAKALTKLYAYIKTQGSGAAHYAQALELINQAESKL